LDTKNFDAAIELLPAPWSHYQQMEEKNAKLSMNTTVTQSLDRNNFIPVATHSHMNITSTDYDKKSRTLRKPSRTFDDKGTLTTIITERGNDINESKESNLNQSSMTIDPSLLEKMKHNQMELENLKRLMKAK
jgi:hypothetical protein